MKKTRINSAVLLAAFGNPSDIAGPVSFGRQRDRDAETPTNILRADINPVTDFEQYRVASATATEVLYQDLYDWNLYPQAGQQSISFFQNAVGQGVTSTPGNVVGTNKLESDTNMTGNGALPNGMAYLVQRIEIYFQPGSVATASTFTPAGVTTSATGVLAAAPISALNDINQFYNEGLVKFKVLNKNQITDTPCRKFAPSNWMEFDSSLSTTAATTSLAIAAGRVKGDPYQIIPIFLQPMMNFNVSIEWPAARALPSGFNGRVGVVFKGQLKRAAQ